MLQYRMVSHDDLASMQNSESSALKVIVGISGGVDSSVAALLLKEQGFEVEGLFMKNWEEDDTAEHCTAKEDLADARHVCQILDIPLHTVNFAQEYWQNVFQYFLEEYKQGRTPNPDILCNREIKFKEFLHYAQKLGADFIATGHYAGKGFSNDEHQDHFQLLKAFDENKDQTYFLYTLGQAQLAKSLFPLANLSKERVRKLAESYGLPTAEKKDSTGICFIGERKFKNFLQEFLENEPGNIEDLEGNIIGQHDGLMFHTLGQRQGLKIGGVKDASDLPWYVVGKDMTRNTLIAAQGTDHPALYCDKLIASQLHWVRGKPGDKFDCCAKVRYRQQEEPCTVEIKNGVSYVTFKNQQRAVTPGQSVVFYNSQECLGGGVIESTNALLGLKPAESVEKAIL